MSECNSCKREIRTHSEWLCIENLQKENTRLNAALDFVRASERAERNQRHFDNSRALEELLLSRDVVRKAKALLRKVPSFLFRKERQELELALEEYDKNVF